MTDIFQSPFSLAQTSLVSSVSTVENVKYNYHPIASPLPVITSTLQFMNTPDPCAPRTEQGQLFKSEHLNFWVPYIPKGIPIAPKVEVGSVMKAGSDGPSIKIIPFPSVKGKADDKTLGNKMKPIITRKSPTATRTSGQILSWRLACEKAKIEASMQLSILEIKKSAPTEDSKEEVMVLPGLYKSRTEDITFCTFV